MQRHDHYSPDRSNLSRKVESHGTSMKLPEITITGNIPHETLNRALEDLSRMEDCFFALQEKLKVKMLEDMKVPALKAEKPISQATASATQPCSAKPEVNSVQQGKADRETTRSRELEERFKAAQQIFLREVDHEVSGIFMGAGSRYVKKAGRKCFVVYLKADGENCFLSGTQLQEEVKAQRLVAGDYITITKTGQFRRANDRSHAKAATFDIRVLEKAPGIEDQ